MHEMSTKKRSRCREVTVVQGFKQESVYGLSAKIVAVVKRWPWMLVKV